jgi:hypothetical protein
VLRVAYRSLVERHAPRHVHGTSSGWGFSLARNPQTPLDVLDDMAMHSLSGHTAEQLLKHKGFTREHIHQVTERHLGLTERVALSPGGFENNALIPEVARSRKVGPDTLRMVSESAQAQRTKVRLNLANNSKTPTDVLEKCVKIFAEGDEHRERDLESAGYALGKNRALPLPRVLELIEDPANHLIRPALEYGMSVRSDMTAAVANAIARGDYPGATSPEVYEHEGLDSGVLVSALVRGNLVPVALRKIVAHPQMPSEGIELAASNKHFRHFRARAAAAQSPRLSLPTLAKLLDDPRDEVRESARGAVRHTVAAQLGIDERNSEAIDFVMQGDWSALGPDSPEVTLALAMHQNP